MASLGLPKEVNDALERVAEELRNLLNDISMPDSLREASMHYLKNRGKMIRPILTLLSTYLLGGNVADAIYPAIAIELIHIASLLQDDIIDRHLTRRGSETPFKRFGTEYTMLASDVLIAKAVEYSLKSSTKKIAVELANAAIKLAIGQSYEIEHSLGRGANFEAYMRIVRNKTAALISTALVMGGYVVDAPVSIIGVLRDIGENLGIAYQIRDDIIDYLNLDEANPKGLRSIDINIIDVLINEGVSDPLAMAYSLFKKHLNAALNAISMLKGWDTLAKLIMSLDLEPGKITGKVK